MDKHDKGKGQYNDHTNVIIHYVKNVKHITFKGKLGMISAIYHLCVNVFTIEGFRNKNDTACSVPKNKKKKNPKDINRQFTER
jgi:hypothetical protein